MVWCESRCGASLRIWLPSGDPVLCRFGVMLQFELMGNGKKSKVGRYAETYPEFPEPVARDLPGRRARWGDMQCLPERVEHDVPLDRGRQGVCEGVLDLQGHSESLLQPQRDAGDLSSQLSAVNVQQKADS